MWEGGIRGLLGTNNSPDPLGVNNGVARRVQGFSPLLSCQTQPADRLDTRTLEQGKDHTARETGMLLDR